MVDYENITQSAILEGTILNWKEDIIRECLVKIGIVKVGLIFIPLHLVKEDRLEEFDSAGFDCIVCPKKTIYEKEKDSVDSRMIALSKKLFDEHSDITDIVIVSNDGDFTPLVTFFKHRGKRITLFGLGKISTSLKKSVDAVYEISAKKMT